MLAQRSIQCRNRVWLIRSVQGKTNEKILQNETMNRFENKFDGRSRIFRMSPANVDIFSCQMNVDLSVLSILSYAFA